MALASIAMLVTALALSFRSTIGASQQRAFELLVAGEIPGSSAPAYIQEEGEIRASGPDVLGSIANFQENECTNGFQLEARTVSKGIQISWDCSNPSHTRGIQMRVRDRNGPLIGTISYWSPEYLGPLPTKYTDQNTKPGKKYWYRFDLLDADSEVIAESEEVSVRDTRPTPEPQPDPEPEPDPAETPVPTASTDAHSDSDPGAHCDANGDPDRDGDPYSHSYPHPHADGDAYADAYADAHCYCYRHSNAYAHAESNAYTHPFCDSHAAPHGNATANSHAHRDPDGHRHADPGARRNAVSDTACVYRGAG